MLWEDAAALGLPVFPCLSNKKPCNTHGFLEAETEPGAIKRLFHSYERNAVLIGVPTGERVGFDVLDIDTARHPEATEWMKTRFLPAARIHRTESGGWHYLFKHNPRVKIWSNRPVPGIDGRGEGGYVIWWPHKGLDTVDAEIIDWPARILDEVCPVPKKQNPQIFGPSERINNALLDGVMRRVLGAINGERNTLLFWGACRFGAWVARGEISTRVSTRLLQMTAMRLGLDEIEAQKTIASGLSRGANDGNPNG